MFPLKKALKKPSMLIKHQMIKSLNNLKVLFLKNTKEKIFLIFLFLIFIFYFFLAFNFGVNTPFALIDDLSEWQQTTIISNIFGSFKNFFLLNSGDRFRPFYDLSTALFFKLWPTQFEIHHLVRIFQKIAIYLTGLHTLKMILKDKIDSFFPFLIFTIFFLIHPIAPEARLAPQELSLLFFGALLLNRVVFHHQQNSLDFKKFKVKNILELMILGIFAALSKENGIVFPLWLISILILKNLRNLSKKHIFFLLIYSFIIFFLLLKIFIASKTGYLSTDSFSISTIYKKLYYGLAFPLLFQGNPVPLFLYFILIRFYWKNLNLKFLRSQSFEILNILFLIFTFFTIRYPHRCPRYCFQNAFLFSLIISIVLGDFFKRNNNKKLRSISLVILSLIFFGNIFNYTFQWTSQYFTRKNELNLLDKMKKITSENKLVGILGNSEYESKIWIYFNEYLPFINQEKVKINYVQKNKILDVDYLVTREKLNFENIYNGFDSQFVKNSYPFLNFSNIFFDKFISKSHYCDCGAPNSITGDEWFIYKIN
jgi:hypothetical protein